MSTTIKTTLALGILALALGACGKKNETAAATSGSVGSASVNAAPAPTAAAPTTPAAAAPVVTCKALIDHMVTLQEAEKKAGIINRGNSEKMTARCEKAGNMKDQPAVVECLMSANKVAAMTACKDMGKLLGPW